MPLSNLSITALQRQAAALLLYQSVMQTAPAQAFLKLLRCLQQADPDPLSGLPAYGDWFQQLAQTGLSWQDSLMCELLYTDNPFTRQVQQQPLETLPSPLIAAARQDLQALQQLYHCDGYQIAEWVQTANRLESSPVVWEVEQAPAALQPLVQHPLWSRLKSASDWADLLPDLAEFYRQHGTGLFARYPACRWQDSQLQGIAYPDPVQLNALVGYDNQKATLQQNTAALLAGYPALHILLYGSRGSGKSSLVKALLSTYQAQGLRLIEVNKADLHDLPAIVDRVRGLPQKFVIFVDDLSFEEDDDAYKALKVVLEGSVTARPQNVVVYATSNRRHLIREFFDDRPSPRDADEIHHWDTVQEKLSFSDRFGLTLTFEPADQDTYLQIVRHLAEQAHLELDAETLEYRALQWATRHNGRSGRTARQFVDFLQAEQRLQTEATGSRGCHPFELKPPQWKGDSP